MPMPPPTPTYSPMVDLDVFLLFGGGGAGGGGGGCTQTRWSGHEPRRAHIRTNQLLACWQRDLGAHCFKHATSDGGQELRLCVKFAQRW